MEKKEKTTRLMGVPACPAEHLDAVKDIFEEYVEDVSTIKAIPTYYKVQGQIKKNKVMEFHREIERLSDETRDKS